MSNTNNSKKVFDISRPTIKGPKVTNTKKPKKVIKSTKLKPHQHPFIIPVITFLVLFFISIVGFIMTNGQTIGPDDSHVVRISIEGESKTVPTRAKNVKDFLDRANIEINEGDVVEPELNSEINDDDFRVNVYKARPVTIIDGDNRTQTLSAAKTPRSVAQQAGIEVYPEDSVEVISPSQEILKDGVIGEKVVVDRATLAHLNLYGTQVSLRTRAKNVGELLKEKNINIGEGDTVQPNSDTPISADVQIFVTRVGTQLTTVEEEIAMPVETVEDPSLTFGAIAIRQKGSPGKKVVTYQIETQNGQEVSRKVIQEVVAVQPVKQIEARGKAYTVPDDKSSLLTAAGISLGDYPYVNHIISSESGWCATKWQGQVGYCPGYYSEIHSPSSGYGYGLCQATPAGKMASAGADWATNPVTQLRWCSGYAVGRYGSWEAAYNFWSANHWW
ncbi:DUF348 domain-containing protein [Candidatus Saccharibacteria bacterium]|nr:DUF348 domain-containing protein [Candidatus Saccharibacteria bacterium]